MIFKNSSILILLCAWGLACANELQTAKIKHLDLQSNLFHQINSDLKLCLDEKCEENNIKIYPLAKQRNNFLFEIKKPFSVGLINKSKKGFSFEKLMLINDWDDFQGPEVTLELGVNIYNISESKFVISINRELKEFYSGGVGAFVFANFYEVEKINELSAAKSKLIFESLPNSCFKSIRSCFAENEYKNKSSCNEVTKGFVKPKIDALYENSTFEWEEFYFGMKDERNSKAKYSYSFKMPFEDLISDSRVRFCGGPS